jgi:hypothetical protein
LDNIKVDNELLVQLLGHSKEFDSSNIIPVVRTDQVLKGLGMKPSDADNYLVEMISEFIGKCKKLVSPRAAYVLYEQVKFDLTRHKVIISEKELNTGKIVTSFLKKSEAVIMFSCTCGPEVEHLSKQLMKNGNALEGFIVDLIGSELAESIAGNIHDYIGEKLATIGVGITNRFSPGYCNWPVTDQQKLFSLLKGNNCGIKLTPSSLMLPIKSISCILGISASVERTAYKCRICKDEKCIMREDRV